VFGKNVVVFSKSDELGGELRRWLHEARASFVKRTQHFAKGYTPRSDASRRRRAIIRISLRIRYVWWRAAVCRNRKRRRGTKQAERKRAPARSPALG